MSVPSTEEIVRRIREFKPVEIEPEVISETYHKPPLYSLLAPFKKVQVSPLGVADVVFHALSYRLEGKYSSKIINTGLTSIRGLSVTSDLESEGQKIFEGLKLTLGTLRRGGERDYTFNWTISRGIGTLWTLINVWLSGKTHIKESFTASALRFSSRGIVEAVVPVRNIQVAWD